MPPQRATQEAPTATAPAPDMSKVEAFVVDKVLRDLGGTTTGALVAIGDRHGLFKDLAAKGPATSRELAARTGLSERHLREWASGLAAAGYLGFDPATKRFALGPEEAFVLATEGGPCSVAGAYQEVFGCLRRLDDIARTFRAGGGVAPEDFDQDVWVGLERLTQGWFESYLVQSWLPAMPHVVKKLEAGCEVADVGCGAGRALVALAKAYPRSRFVGYDVHAPSLERARALAKQEGVADRVRFESRDAAKGLPTKFDLVTTFDVVHDAADPEGIAASVRRALKPGGSWFLLEINCQPTIAGNSNPVGIVVYGFSNLFCMTTSLAQGGQGLGTAGLPEPEVRALCQRAGFSAVQRLPVEDLFNVLYEARA